MKCALSPLVLGSLLGSGLLAQPADRAGDDTPPSADGRADLDAPPPRQSEGRPDLSGVWMLKATIDPGLIGLPMGPEMFDIGASLEKGLPYQPWAAESVAANRADMRARDPLSHCLPIGPVRLHTITSYRELVQLPDQLLILNEHNATFRRIPTDGPPLPPDVVPKVHGHSVGRWSGDTLVVETTGFLDGALWLDAYGSPLTDAARIVERFRRVSFGELHIELTVDDPKAYTEPWAVTLTQTLLPDAALDESFCAEEALIELLSEAAD